MKTHYLIDYENRHNNAFIGIETLTKKDHMHVFSTANARLNVSDLALNKDVKIKFHSVPAGKESLDLCLVSTLGYLISESKRNTVFVIVSQDRGFDHVINYWKIDKNVVIVRRDCIATPAIQNEQQLAKKLLCEKVQRVLADADIDGNAINRTAAIVSKNFTQQHRKKQVYLTLLSTYGQAQGLKLYKIIKDLL
ncbi:MAG: hypothetical protein IJV46_09675 [Acidaminococcaceae bacterium]|nr:hypothetical protein [Acidaminococcaceae bacterium]